MGMRFILVTLVLTLLVSMLVSCGGGATVATPEIEADAFFGSDDADLLKDIALMLTSTSVYTQTHDRYNTREILVAAYRGYDMLDPDFDDSKIDPNENGTPNIDAVITLIEKANEKAGVDTKILNDKYKDKTILTEDAVLRLINSMKTKVELTTETGFLDTLLGWIGVALGWITNLFGGFYIIGICIFAIVIELLMMPLTIKQHKSSIKQAKLRPKEMAIRKKYAGRDDQATRQKMAAEMQELYQRENVSAASGCLPLIIQLPIILALYNIVIDPLHYVLGQAAGMSQALSLYYTTARAAGGIGAAASAASRGTISILSGIKNAGGLDGIKDFALIGNGEEVYTKIAESGWESLSFSIGPLDLGAIPSLSEFNWLLLIPVLTFVVYFFSMRLTKKFTYQPSNAAMTGADGRQAACSGWMMDIMMPLMSVYITFMVPALIGVYWMFKSILSTLSRFIITRVMPYPEFTEEDYRAAEREYAGKAPRKQAGQYSYGKETKMVGGKPKSLFHMDDDDYVAKIEAEAKEAEEKETSKPADKRVGGETLKDDDRPSKKSKWDD